MDKVVRAMRAVDRAWFLPESQRSHVNVDAPLPIGHGQTNSQPSTVRNMLDLLRPFPGMRVLDVGCGSGWTTALLAELGGSDATVIGVELVPDLAERARATIASLRIPQAQVRLAIDGVLGLPEDAPFDRILVSAESRTMPSALVDQLGRPGIMVAPWAGTMHRVVQGERGEMSVTDHGGYRFVPLL